MGSVVWVSVDWDDEMMMMMMMKMMMMMDHFGCVTYIKRRSNDVIG